MKTMTIHEGPHVICDEVGEGIYTDDKKAVCCKCSGHCFPGPVSCDCETLGLPDHTDDLGCMVKPCVLCGKKWFACGSCKRQDFETEEELTEHFSERHFEEIGEMFAPDGDGDED